MAKPTPRSDSASSLVGGSPARPDGRRSSPMCTRPLRNVPVVTTSAPQRKEPPSSNASPATRPPSIRIRPARRNSHVMLGSSDSISRTQAP